MPCLSRESVASIAILSVLTFGAVACGAGASDSLPQPLEPDPTTQFVDQDLDSTQYPPNDCGGNYPEQLNVEAESTEEMSSLALISACGSRAGDRLRLANHSEMVWQIWVEDRAGPVVTTHSARTPAQEILQRVAGDISIMEPDSAVEVPVHPAYVHWYAVPALTGVYASLTKTQALFVSSAIDKSPELLRKGSRARAHATCAVAGYQAADAAIETSEADSMRERTEAVTDAVESVFEGAGKCRDAVNAADSEQLKRGQISKRVLPEMDATRQLRLNAIAEPVMKSWAVAGKNVVRRVF